jgi:plastocyanin
MRRPPFRALGGLAAATTTVLAAMSLASCSSSSKTSTPASQPPSSAPALTIKNFAFSPNPLTVTVGETVIVTNNDTTAHTTTDSGGAFDTGAIAPGTSKTITIAKAGTYHFHCNIHPSMKGTIQTRA